MSDLISRQKAIDYFVEHTSYVDEDGKRVPSENILRKMWTEVFSKIPSAEPERKWIPASEVLPEGAMRVLTTIETNHKGKQVRSGFYYQNYFHNDNGDTWNATDKEVLAWMPLPEPYRGE